MLINPIGIVKSRSGTGSLACHGCTLRIFSKFCDKLYFFKADSCWENAGDCETSFGWEFQPCNSPLRRISDSDKYENERSMLKRCPPNAEAFPCWIDHLRSWAFGFEWSSARWLSVQQLCWISLECVESIEGYESRWAIPSVGWTEWSAIWTLVQSLARQFRGVNQTSSIAENLEISRYGHSFILSCSSISPSVHSSCRLWSDANWWKHWTNVTKCTM